MNEPNLAILFTGAGVSALATVRLVGPIVPAFLAQHFSRATKPGGIVHGELRDNAGVVDDPVVAMAADGSYVDITLHGGSWVVLATLELAARAGFTRVDRESIPLEAFPESSDLFDAELQIALPRARTELAVRTLLGQAPAWKTWIDSGPDADSIRNVLADHSLRHLLHPPTVAIVGLPNAGKSTLANHLFGQQRSIVSPVAGTTRDWVGEEANLDGLIVKLIDTPGRHETNDSIERQAIAQSDQPIAEADLVIVLLDGTDDDPRQEALADRFQNAIIVVNKVDQPGAAVESSRNAIRISARTGQGIPLLIAAVHDHFGIGTRPAGAARCWTGRQATLTKAAFDQPGQLVSIFAGTKARIAGHLD